MKVDHAVVAGLFTDVRGRELLAASQRQITGYLVDSEGNVVRQVSKPGKPDKVWTSHFIYFTNIVAPAQSVALIVTKTQSDS